MAWLGDGTLDGAPPGLPDERLSFSPEEHPTRLTRAASNGIDTIGRRVNCATV
jgi:hypothetical protein